MQEWIKRGAIFVISLLLGFALVIGYAQTFVFHQTQAPKPNKNQVSSFSVATAPRQSLRGVMQDLSGEVSWQSRIASEPATITSPQPIQQGETLETKQTGKVTIVFPTAGSVTLLPKTSLQIIQTLPVDLVFEQDSGTVTYQEASKSPMSVRSLHLLVEQSHGQMTVTTDPEQSLITVITASNSATAAYNDSQNTSTVVQIPERSTFVFDDTTRENSLSAATR